MRDRGSVSSELDLCKLTMTGADVDTKCVRHVFDLSRGSPLMSLIAVVRFFVSFAEKSHDFFVLTVFVSVVLSGSLSSCYASLVNIRDSGSYVHFCPPRCFEHLSTEQALAHRHRGPHSIQSVLSRALQPCSHRMSVIAKKLGTSSWVGRPQALSLAALLGVHTRLSFQGVGMLQCRVAQATVSCVSTATR